MYDKISDIFLKESTYEPFINATAAVTKAKSRSKN
jgi:hypothetical protein